jgi:hypothetical protein
MAVALNVNGPLFPAVFKGGVFHADDNLVARNSMIPGTGISGVSGMDFRNFIYRMGDVIYTVIFIDLAGCNSGDTDGDIIGKASTANCHIGQVTTLKNGLIYKGKLSCVETPATGEPDIDVFTATEATGTEEEAISGLTSTSMLAAAADWTKGVQKDLTGNVIADKYLYLVASGGATNDTYTAGQFVLELWGYVV